MMQLKKMEWTKFLPSLKILAGNKQIEVISSNILVILEILVIWSQSSKIGFFQALKTGPPWRISLKIFPLMWKHVSSIPKS